MTANTFILTAGMAVMCFLYPGEAEASLPSDTIKYDALSNDYYGVIFPHASEPSRSFRNHFSWGLEIGSSVDVTGYDLTTFNADGCFGYRNSMLKMVGLGFGVHRAFGNGNAFVPVYAILRTSLRTKPTPIFLDIRAGYSFNTISNEHYRGGFQMSFGLGYTLTSRSRVSSHITAGYGYYHINATQTQHLNMGINHADYAIVGFGVTF